MTCKALIKMCKALIQDTKGELTSILGVFVNKTHYYLNDRGWRQHVKEGCKQYEPESRFLIAPQK